MSGLIFGSLLANCLPQINRISEKNANGIGILACVALVLCLSLCYWRAPWALVWMTSLAQMAAAGFLVSASSESSWVRRTLSARPLVAIGIISYGMYLWHYPAAVFYRDLLPWYQTVPAVVIFALATATASYLTIERPLQWYRRSLKAGRREMDAETKSAGDDGALLPANEYSRSIAPRVSA
jgi:peptidoglycan/LPS O-acetylase OafA/YrhL